MTECTIIIEKGNGNCSACCPDQADVGAAAETEEETVELMKEAIELIKLNQNRISFLY